MRVDNAYVYWLRSSHTGGANLLLIVEEHSKRMFEIKWNKYYRVVEPESSQRPKNYNKSVLKDKLKRLLSSTITKYMNYSTNTILTFFHHPLSDALLKTTILAPVSCTFCNGTAFLSKAHERIVRSCVSSEKTFTRFTTQNAEMVAGSGISADAACGSFVWGIKSVVHTNKDYNSIGTK